MCRGAHGIVSHVGDTLRVAAGPAVEDGGGGAGGAGSGGRLRGGVAGGGGPRQRVLRPGGAPAAAADAGADSHHPGRRHLGSGRTAPGADRNGTRLTSSDGRRRSHRDQLLDLCSRSINRRIHSAF